MRLFLLSLVFCCAAGCGNPSFLVTPVANSNKLEEEEVDQGKGWAADKIAIIEVEGMLVNARSGGFLQPTENSLSLFTQQLKHAAEDPAVKAVVLRVNSPGGTVSTSDAMYQMVKDFRQKTHKPVIASAQEVAASGAYYVSCAADKIIAQPTTVVGSIGVIFNSLDFEGTLDKIGARSWAIKSGPLKDMGSPFKHLTAREEAVMQEMVDEYFIRFQQIVSSNRPVTERPPATMPADYEGVYSGRVFSGEQAMQLGLVDQTGLLADAINVARKMANARGAKVVMYKRPYGYGGSIYATSPIRSPRADVLKLELPGIGTNLPSGFYYLWRPGL